VLEGPARSENREQRSRDAGINPYRTPMPPNRSALLPEPLFLFPFQPVFPGGRLSPGAAPSRGYRAFLTPITRFFKSTPAGRREERRAVTAESIAPARISTIGELQITAVAAARSYLLRYVESATSPVDRVR
jgi:hypothetical protein